MPPPRTPSLAPVNCAYFDYNATAPLRPEATEAIERAWRLPANPSSVHIYGAAARDAVEQGRGQLALLLDCSPTEICFTSGATEANNLALRSLSSRPGRPLVSAVEHPAVLAAAAAWTEDEPPAPVWVDNSGRLDLDGLSRLLTTAKTSYVSVMAANNETGVLLDVTSVTAVAHEHGVPVHTDATQMVGRLPVSFTDLDVDMLSMSAHKFGGPQGVGALVVRREWMNRLVPLQHGGGQERGLRSGTLNVAGIVGMGAAAAAVHANLHEEMRRTGRMRDDLEARLLNIPQSIVHGQHGRRLPGVTNVSFRGAPADAVMACMPEVAVSHGSACSGGAPGTSHVLAAMGVDPEDAECAIRFSLGYGTSTTDVEFAASATAAAVRRVRAAMMRGLSHASTGSAT